VRGNEQFPSSKEGFDGRISGEEAGDPPTITRESSEEIDERTPRIRRVAWSGLERLLEGDGEERRAKLLRFLEGQSHVLEMIARSDPLASVLDELTRVLEDQVEGMACSALLMSEDRQYLRLGAAPNLPDSYRPSIDGVKIGPRAGSCGTAAFLGRPVIVTDIAGDPLWTDYKDPALAVGLRSCWSTPIISSRNEVLGTFAMYHRQPFAPSARHLGLIDLATNLARIAIERDAAERDRERLWNAKRFADRYRMVLQATKEAVWEWDLENDTFLWSGGQATFGYEAEDMESTFDWWMGRTHPQDVERIRRHIELAIDSGKPHWEEECRYRRKNGTYADVIVSGLIVRDETGKAVRIVGSLQDITRRKRQELEVKQQAERFKSATVAADVGTWRLDVTTQYMLTDARLNRMVGNEERETVQQFRDVIRVIHPEDRARVAEAIDESIATGRPFESDHRIVLASGEIRWLRSRGRVLTDGEGRAQVLTGAAADITKLKRAEQSMAILADSSRALAESLDSEQILSVITRMAVPSFCDAAMVILKDPETGEPRVAFVHASNPELLAVAKELQQAGTLHMSSLSRRVLQTGVPELHPTWTAEWLVAQEIDENVAMLARRFHITSTIHVPISSPPLGVIVFAGTGTRVYNSSDLAFAEELAHRASGAIHNARLFQAAKAERKRAEEAAALRERLVAIVGHDLRNPLAAISMAAQILTRSGLNARDQTIVNRIQSSANRMMRMIGQILDFARIRAGMGITLDVKPVNLHQICQEVVDEMRLGNPDQQIELDADGSGESVCDPDRVAQVVSNVIGNAIQHMTKGPICVTVRDAEPDDVAIAVHNVGSPIPEHVQANIFDAFHREVGDKDRASGSIGLGLFIAREISKAHGGTITVRSPDRDGTTFIIVIPRKPAGAERGE
jgi:PAS domain S-box-containing protein